MKYSYNLTPVPPTERKNLNEKVLYLIDSNTLTANSITAEDIFNAYTGEGGLHGLSRNDYDNYHEYSEAKKDVENGQFFTPPMLCEFIVSCLRLSDHSLVSDLTCGMGSFFNFLPTEANIYGCEIDPKAYKVAHFLYPNANIECMDIRSYKPGVRFDYVLGNPPFHLKWRWEDGTELPSQMYYCLKAAELLKPLGIMALITPQSFLADSFTDGGQIREMEQHFSFLGQIILPDDSFAALGVRHFPVKLQFWQKKSSISGWTPQPYHTDAAFSLSGYFEMHKKAESVHKELLSLATAVMEDNQSRVLLELAKSHSPSGDFAYQTQKLLYQIKVHPAVKSRYAKCCEYLHRFYTQKRPPDVSIETWNRTRLTEGKVLSYLKRTLKKQNQKAESDRIALVKQDDNFVYKGYSTSARRQMTASMKQPVPVYQAVLDNDPTAFPGYERLLRRKRAEYDIQSQLFSEMEEDPEIAKWLSQFTLWDAENVAYIHLNDIQLHDINLTLQKRYAVLQWEQGSGKTLAAIATGLYRMERQGIQNTVVISSAISIRNNWNVVLDNYSLPYVFVEKMSDLDRIQPGDFVLMTLNRVTACRKQLRKWTKCRQRKLQLILDESDEISNPRSSRCQSVLSCFRRCRMKLLTTGTSTRNNISEFAPQLELLYNNSINMVSWNTYIYRHERNAEKDDPPTQHMNPFYGAPIPAYKKGYSLFASSFLPEHVTVFGMEQRTQDIYNADILTGLLEKTVITRTFEEVACKDIKRLHQVPLQFPDDEKLAYQKAMNEFNHIRFEYFESTGNARKDAMMRLVQQITLLLRIAAAPDSVREYTGTTPVKVITAVEMAAQWSNEIVAVGVRHKIVLDSYAKAFQEYLPDRPLFIVTGESTSFAKRRALRQTLRDSKNGILLCTQQSLPSSVNFEFVNKVIIPELHYNNAGMSQFYFRFIRYTSMEYKDIYFLTYAGSIESNLMQMVLAKEKLNLFMKGQDVDLDSIYEKFDVDYDLLSMLMLQEKDEKGVLRIRWGEQKIA